MKYYCDKCKFKTIRLFRIKEHKKIHNPTLISFEDLEKLMSPTRFDIIAKYLYVKYYDKKINSNFYIELYSKHIESLNGYWEYPGTKTNLSEFLDHFNKLIESIKNEGFNEKYFIPVGYKYNIINGSHRTAISYYYKMKPFITIDENNKTNQYPYTYFTQNTKYPYLDALYTDEMALQYIKINKNIRCMILHPKITNNNIYDKLDKLDDIIKNYGIIYYKKTIELTDKGYYNLIKELYRGEEWIGGIFPTKGYNKFLQCKNNKTPHKVILILIAFDNPINNIELKKNCRKIFKIKKTSLHTTDYNIDTFRVASALLNKNSIHFLNNGTNNLSNNTEKLLESYFEYINTNNYNYNENFCITSSCILEMYGLRNANDIDYLHENDYNIQINNINCHNKKWLSYYTIDKHDIIYNPNNYFYFNGYKFATLNIIYKMKENRNEEKDKIDIELIKNFNSNYKN
jgi:hypothetical protein